MKLPNNLDTINTDVTEENKVEVNITEIEPERFNYSFLDFDNPKALIRYIKSIESMVRGSLEYRKYIRFLKEEQDLSFCKFLSNVDINNIHGVSIELHHYPFSLYDIVEIILKKQTNNYFQSTNTFSVCNEVMRIHYENMIGLVPLTKTVHELAHSGEIFIPFNLVYGNLQQFISTYGDYISTDLMDSFNSLNKLSESNNLNSNKFILKQSFQEIELPNRNILLIE